MTGANAKQLHAYIDGRVQGVGFRFFVQEEADRLGLTGWVRNLFDGRVEAVAEGPEPSLQQLLEAIRRGPSSSYVSNVDFEWNDATGKWNRFNISSMY